MRTAKTNYREQYLSQRSGKKLLFYLTCFALLVGLSFANISKLYIGNEDGQVILGAESYSTNLESGAGLDFRSYLKKEGTLVDGQEYGAMAGKTKLSFLMAGAQANGAVYRFRHDWTFSRDVNYDDLIIDNRNDIETGYGKGIYLLFH